MYGLQIYGRQLYGGSKGLDNNLRVESIDYQARIVFTVGGTTYRLATTSLLRDGNWHEPALAIEDIEPTTEFPDEFGIVAGDEIEVPIYGDYKSLMDEDLDGTEAKLEILSIVHRSNGSQVTQSHTQTLTIQGASMDVGVVRLNLASLENVKLDQVYPSTEYTVDDYAEIFEEHVGRPVCKVIGLGIKVPCTLISTGGGSGPWVFAICETGPAVQKATGSQDGVLTVYRNNRVVDASEYTVSTDTTGTKDVLTVEFTKEPIGFDGNFYEITADVRDTTSVSRNVATELERLLGEAGVGVDSDSITAGESVAADESMLMDYVYGRDGQRTFKAHLEDLLFILRGGLRRNTPGDYVLFQDKEGGSATRYDELAGHPVEFSNYQRPSRNTTAALSYKPSIQDTSKLRHTVTRSVTGGTLGDAKPREIPQLMDHTAAGKLVDYLSKREQFNRTVEIYTGHDQFLPTKLIGGKNKNFWTGEKLWQVRSSSMVPAGSSVVALEYDPAVYNTSAGTPPSDATTGYQPDFSETPPDAPTSLSVDASDAEVNDDGGVTSWATVSATPPSENFRTLFFESQNDSTNEITIQEGEETSNGDWETTFASLRPNVNYTIKSWARNKFSVKGQVASTSHSTATETGAPADPTNVTIAQAKSRFVELTFDHVEPPDLKQYEIQIKTSSGGSYGSTIPIGKSRKVNIPASGYSFYQVQVRAKDNSGNTSNFVESNDITLARNIGSSDVVASGIQTGNIADDGVTSAKRQGINTVSGSITIPAVGKIGTSGLSINENDEPVVSGGGNDLTQECFGMEQGASTTSVFVLAGTLSGGSTGGSLSVSYDYW